LFRSESTGKEELTIGEMKPLYLGPTFHYVEYTLTDNKSKTKEKIIVDLPFSTIVDFNKSNGSIPADEEYFFKYYFNNTYLQQQEEMRKQNANTQWNILEKEMANSSNYSLSSTSTLRLIIDVPGYIWRNGCSPTAAGMVLGYWDVHGYPNFPGETTLIDELANAMGTSYKWPFGDGATWPWRVNDGILSVCRNHHYNNFQASEDVTVSWAEIKNEVYAGRPFVLSMLNGGTGNGHNKAYNHHSVTCMGCLDGDQDYVYIKDTWDRDIHYLAYGDWTAVMAVWVRP
ncbi:MAG: C39 family peptidase, partial [Methanosarcina vacuolata]|nr:C39 family peptidase [Methanosarcina vacuolata]